MESVIALIYWLLKALLLFASLLVVLFAGWGLLWFCRGLYSAYRSPALKIRNLRLDLDSVHDVELTLVTWFETNGFQVQQDNSQWFAWVDDHALSLTEMAVAIFLAMVQEQTAASIAQGRTPEDRVG